MRIYLFSPIRYDFLHQRPGMLRAILASIGDHLIGLLAMLLPFTPIARPRVRSPRAELDIVSLPVTYPTNRVNSRFLEWMTAAAYRHFLFRRALSSDPAESVAIVQHPFWGNVLLPGDFSTICYDCLDDVSLAAGNASGDRFREYEQRLIDMSDCIVTTAEKLESRLREQTTRPIVRIPNGVDYEWFRKRASEA